MAQLNPNKPVVLRFRLENTADPLYIENNVDYVEPQQDIAQSAGVVKITGVAPIVIWNDRAETKYFPVYQGMGTKYLLKSNERICITPGSVAELLYYFAVADDIGLVCASETEFNAEYTAKGGAGTPSYAETISTPVSEG